MSHRQQDKNRIKQQTARHRKRRWQIKDWESKCQGEKDTLTYL